MEAEPPPANQNNFDDTQRIAKCKAKPELINLNQIYPNDSGSHCGYCNKDDTSYSWSFTSKTHPYFRGKNVALHLLASYGKRMEEKWYLFL